MSRTGKSPHGLIVIAVAVAVVLFISLRGKDRRHLLPPTPAPVAELPPGAVPIQPGTPAPVSPAAAAPHVDAALVELVRPPRDRSETDGIAIALLVDTSGSMNTSIPDTSGSPRRKIDLAKRASLDMIDRIARFAAQHPDRPVKVGLYEFHGQGCKALLPLGALDRDAMAAAVERLQPSSGTPIGEAMLAAKHDLDRGGLTRKHMLVVTDGENTAGRDPAAVARAIASLPQEERADFHCIAFQVEAARFQGVKDAGGLVVEARSAAELARSMEFILERKILLELPETPVKKE
jgi:Mg-chelatase subunit ChlD